MKLDYSVHSVGKDRSEITAKVGGKDRQVLADVLTVELVAEGSALTFRFDDVEDAEKLFQRGKKISLTFAGVK